MTKFSDEDRKAIMREARENLDWCKQIERDRIERLQRMFLPDPMVSYRAEADARQAAEEAETRQRIREAKRDQREHEIRRALVAADIDGRIGAAVETLRTAISEGDAGVLQAVTDALMPLFDKIGDKMTRLEGLLQKLRAMSAEERAQPVDLPSGWRSLRHVRDVN